MYPVVYYLIRSDLSKGVLLHEVATSTTKLHGLLRLNKRFQADLTHSLPRILEVPNEQALQLYRARMKAHNTPCHLNTYQGRGSVLVAGPTQNPIIRNILQTLKDVKPYQ